MAIEPEAGGGAAQDDVGEHAVLGPVHREEVRPKGRTLSLTSIAALTVRPRWTSQLRGLAMSAPRRSRGSNRPAARLVPLFLAGALLTGPISGGRAAEPMTAQDTLRELRGFRELGSVLYVAAHPDDENTQLIAYLARGRGYRTAYLSLTRGDGGQNVIGPEIFEELGVIRTQELLAARRLDGGRQFFTRAIDFGFSKNPAETLRIWDRKAVVSDIVRVIRALPARRDHHPLLAPGGRPRPPHGVRDPGRRGLQARGRPQGVPRSDRRAGRLAAQADPPERRRIRPGWRRRRRAPRRDRRRRPGHRRAARDDRRAQPVDAQEPGLRQLRRARRGRPAHRLVHAPGRRAGDQRHHGRRRHDLGPRSRAGPRSQSWPTRRSRSST